MNVIIDFKTDSVTQFGESETDTIGRILRKIAYEIEYKIVDEDYIKLEDSGVTYGFIKVIK